MNQEALLQTELRQRLQRDTTAPALAAGPAGSAIAPPPRGPAERRLTAFDIHRFEWYEQQKELSRKVNPVKCWQEINDAWFGLSDETKASYEAEASVGITQKNRTMPVALPVADAPPAAPVEALALLAPDRPTMLHFDVGQSLAAETAAGVLAITRGSDAIPNSSSYPMAARAFAAGLVQGSSGRPSVNVTAQAFDQLHSKASTGGT